MVIALDEPKAVINGTSFRTAGLTAAPLFAKALRRLAPIMGLRPDLRAGAGATPRFTPSSRTTSPVPRPIGETMASERADKLMGFEALGLLAGARRGGDWSGPLPEITGLSVDSRRTKPGHLFAALPGSAMHGAEFIPYALRMGAVAVLTDPEGLRLRRGRGWGRCGVPVIVQDNPRRALALAAARWSGAQPEVMVAVTGTNGKTSVASFTRQIWEALGERAVNFGTTGVEGAVAAPLAHTTPEPIDAARAAGRAGRRGRDPCGDGGVEPRARPAPAGRGAAGGGGLHQHHPRPSRLPRRLRGVFRRQARRCSPACCRAAAAAVVNLDDPRGARGRRGGARRAGSG